MTDAVGVGLAVKVCDSVALRDGEGEAEAENESDAERDLDRVWVTAGDRERDGE